MKSGNEQNMVKRWLVVLAAVLMVGAGSTVVSGCATGPGEKATGAAADVLLPPEEEERLGDRMRRDVLKELEVHDDERIQRYVSQLGNKAVRAAGNKPEAIDYNFTVVKGDDVNAFAMPGGEIYVYTGLLEAVDSEAELMSVLAHEVAHVSQRHIAQRLVATYGLQALAGAALGENPGVLAQLVANVAGQGYLLKYSRSHESEADNYGLRYMARAGYDPNAFITFFRKMQRGSGARMPEFLSSHPNPQNRISDARRIIAKMDRHPDETGERRYRQMMHGLDSGDGSQSPSRRESPSSSPRRR